MVFFVALSSRLDSVSRPIDASPAPHLSPVVRQHRRRGEPTDTTPDDHDVGRTRRRRRPTPRAMSSFALVLIIHRRASVASQHSSSNPRARAGALDDIARVDVVDVAIRRAVTTASSSPASSTTAR